MDRDYRERLRIIRAEINSILLGVEFVHPDKIMEDLEKEITQLKTPDL